MPRSLLEAKGIAVEHVVFFPTRDGGASFRRLPSFEEAVRLVEHLRNVEGVEQVSVHALTEVPLNFRAYYRVELPQSWQGGPQAAPAASQVPAERASAVEDGRPEVPAQEPPAQPGTAREAPGPESIALEPVGEPLTLVPAAPQQQPAVPEDTLAPGTDSAPGLALVESVPAQAAGPDAGVAASNGRASGSSLGFFA